MSYTPYLIANYATGYDREVQPWLLPDDALTELFDGFVYRGIMEKRQGYSGFANGLESTYCESRMVHNVTFGYTISGDIDGLNDTFTIQCIPPIVPLSVIITGSNPAQTVNDDGAGNLTGDGTGTVNYVTGVINVVFTAPPAVASTITVEYGNFSVGDGTAGPYTATLSNIPLRRGTIALTAGAQTAVDDGVGGFTTNPVGGSGTVNYTTGAISITFANVVASGMPITITYDYHPGNPVMGVMNFYPTNNIRQLIVVDTQYVNRYNAATDRLDDISPASPYNGTNKDFFSWVNYPDASSNPRLLFSNRVNGDVIQQYDGSTVTDYAPTFAAGTLNARQMFEVRGRLVLFQTIEAGVLYPRRIRISGFGASVDDFDNTAIGAGFIDIPDNTWFFGAAPNRDDILFFTESSTWMLKYTGNDVTPFTLERLDNSRGSSAAFSVISYLNRTMAAGSRGLIMSDGYAVDRMDNNIPTFTENDIDDNNFDACFAGFVDLDRDVYLIYPSSGAIRPSLLSAGESDRILVANFEEDNFAIYRLPLSCMGNFQLVQAPTWADLVGPEINNWDELAAQYSNWNAFPFVKGVPISIGGGHKGEIWKLNETETLDNPQEIRDIQIIDAQTLRVTTDWNNYEIGDYIYFASVGGMTELNNKQAQIVDLNTDYTVFDVTIDTTNLSPFTSEGTAYRVIPFVAQTKKLNPFINMDKKIRIGWIYFYVSTTQTDLTDVNGDTIPATITVDVFTDDITNPTKPNFSYQVDCTNLSTEEATKQWVKIWINQTARFLQLRLSNTQAGARIQVHAMMPGIQPVGRLV